MSECKHLWRAVDSTRSQCAKCGEIVREPSEIDRLREQVQRQALDYLALDGQAQELQAEVARLRARVAELEAENAAIRELMNSYNIGGWTDAFAALQRALKAEVEVKLLLGQIRVISADVARLRTALEAAPTPTEPGPYNMGTVIQKEWHNYWHWFLTTRAEALK